MLNIMFLCHGNICRSVAAEWIGRNIVKEKHLEGYFAFDSTAVSYEEEGNDIYPPMKEALRKAGMIFGRHASRRINPDDYTWSDYIFYMDESNLRIARRFLDDKEGKFHPITEYLGGRSSVEDPWYTGRFDEVVDQITTCVKAIIDNLISEALK